ncbi:MAG TPA: hypothetical protein VF805_05510 [Anaeromyxobacteraceae bacterium]
MTRRQILLALLVAVVLGLGMALLLSPADFHSPTERFRDTAAALKKLYRERLVSPRQRRTLTDALDVRPSADRSDAVRPLSSR